jgi:hypothetical protein
MSIRCRALNAIPEYPAECGDAVLQDVVDVRDLAEAPCQLDCVGELMEPAGEAHDHAVGVSSRL